MPGVLYVRNGGAWEPISGPVGPIGATGPTGPAGPIVPNPFVGVKFYTTQTFPGGGASTALAPAATGDVSQAGGSFMDSPLVNYFRLPTGAVAIWACYAAIRSSSALSSGADLVMNEGQQGVMAVGRMPAGGTSWHAGFVTSLNPGTYIQTVVTNYGNAFTANVIHSMFRVGQS